MSNDTMKKEYPDNKQRQAVCFQQWRNKDKKKSEASIPVFPVIYGKVWAIRPEVLEYLAHSTYSSETISKFEARVASKFSDTKGDVAIIPIQGVITPKASILSMLFGGAPLNILNAQFDSAVSDKSIGAIVLEIDSPGGSVFGIHEFADKVYSARGTKPIIAAVNSMAASAAYWIAASADEIVMTRSGEVGSIGTYAVHADESEHLKKEGIAVTVLKAGKFKAQGLPHEPLTDDGKAEIQERIDDYYSLMVTDIAQGRGVAAATIKDGFGQGKIVGAIQAKEMGMVDRIATFEQVITRLAAKPKRSKWAMRKKLELR